MSEKNKKPLERDASGERSARKKRGRIIKKKISAMFSGSIKTPKVKKHAVEDKKKPGWRARHEEQKIQQKEMSCSRLDHPQKMCPKCEIITCRKCNTLHTDTLFVAHSLLEHEDLPGCIYRNVKGI